MELIDAIRERHSVRKYVSRPLDEGTVRVLKERMGELNEGFGLHIQLVTNEPKAFSTGLFKYGAFSGVENYFVMAADKGKEEAVGYCGEMLVLLAQSIGLNTCWVGLTYKKIPGTYVLEADEVVHCVIALGYGAGPGVQHPLRPLENFYECSGQAPQWFLQGVEAARLAPTAVNQQKFKFILHPGGLVEAKTLFSLAGYVKVDLGIVKCHFEIAAGKENFEWE